MEIIRIGPGVPRPRRRLLAELRAVLADAALNFCWLLLGGGVAWLAIGLLT